MNREEAGSRRAVLLDLIALRGPLGSIVAAVRQFPWDSKVDLVLLTRDHAAALLSRYLRGELSAADLEHWADAVESREDVGFEQGSERVLRALLFELANPLLAEPISDSYVNRWLTRLGGQGA